MYPGRVNVYKQNQITTASPGQVLVALYDGAIRYSLVAREAILSKNLAVKGENIGRAMSIVGELKSTLEHSRAPELCSNLERLYNYFIDRLHEAGVKLQVEPLDEVVKHLQDLRNTWAQAVQLAEQEQAVQKVAVAS